MPAPDVAALDWSSIAAALDDDGYAVTPRVLADDACDRLRRCYDDGTVAFRSTIDMARYSFGSGQYRYFDYPLPPVVQSLREAFYRQLAPVANDWAARLGMDTQWPGTLADLTARCRDAGQARPTPLLLRYGKGDYNCLHQDLYGDIHFPLQVVILLSEPGDDFEGGELVLVEQRPRMQSRPVIVRLARGQAAVIPVRERPRQGTRGWHRAIMRHGVAEIVSGARHTLGIIFHDAA